MKKFIAFILISIILFVLAVKLVEPVNDFARENLPDEILRIIGEKPKNVFEKGLDSVKDAINSISG